MRSLGSGSRDWLFTLALAVLATGAQGGENPFDDLSSDPPESITAPDERYYGPGAYLTENRLGEYVAQARSYLTRNPGSPHAAEVAADLLMAGIVLRDGDTQQWARTRLVFDYPRSFAARHAVASFADEKSCRAFLQTLTRSLKDDPSETNCRQLAQALELSLAAWGSTLISEDTFVLECALISYCVQHRPLHQLCRAQLARCSEQAREIATIAFENESTRETIRKLHEIEDNPSALLYEHFFYSRLTPTERRQPEMLRLAAEMHLRGDEFEKALPLVEQVLASQPDPQLLCWQGTCLAVAGRTDEAREVLGSVEREFPETPWAEQAGSLARLIEHQDDSFAQQAEEVYAALSRMRGDGLDQLESRFELRWKGDIVIGGYVAAVLPDNQFEAVLSKDAKILVAYGTTERDCRMYFGGEPAIMEFQQPGTLPLPSGRLEPSEEGGYRYNLSARTSSEQTGTGLSQARDSLLDSPVLSSRESIARWLRYNFFIRSAYFAQPVQQSDGEVVLRWTRPAIAEPTFQRWACHIGRAEPWITVSRGQGAVHFELRHGPADSFELSPPDWPSVPTVKREKMDPTALFRLLGVAVQLIAEDELK